MQSARPPRRRGELLSLKGRWIGIGAGTPPSRGSRASRLHPGRSSSSCLTACLSIKEFNASASLPTRPEVAFHLVYKKPAHSLEHLIEFVCGHLSDRVKNEVLFDAEKALRANKARLIDLAPLTIAAIERNGESIPVWAAGDLAKNQICAGKISNR